MSSPERTRFGVIVIGANFLVIAAVALAAILIGGGGLSGASALAAAGAGVVGSGLVSLVYLALTRAIFRRAVMDRGDAVELVKKLRQAEEGDLLDEWDDIVIQVDGVSKVIGFNAVYRRLVGVFAESERVSRQLNGIASEIMGQAAKLSAGADEQSASVVESTNAMNHIDGSIRKVAGSVEDLAELGETVSSATYQMIASIEEVSGNTKHLTTAVEEVVSAIEEMVANIHGVSESADSLADSASQSRLSMEEIEGATRSIRDRAEEAARLSGAAREGADDAKETLSQTVAGVRDLADKIESAHQVMRDLGVQSHAIGEILTVISSVAADTHLLSLNASIMAAKAGEHGRGFSVVAQEIKTLALRTSQSAKEIENMILDTQESVANAMAAIEEGKAQVGKNMKMSERADLALAEVLEKVDVATHNAREIAKATVNQAEMNARVVKAFDHVAKGAERIRVAMREQERASNYVRERALNNQSLGAQVDNSMAEQASSSRMISKSMETLTTSIQAIRLASEEEAESSAEILRSIEAIRKLADLVAISAQNVSNTSMSAMHHSLLLRNELKGVKLPEKAASTVIGVLLDNLREERWQREIKIFEERAGQLGARCEFRIAEGDARRQFEQAEELAEMGVDLMIVVAVDADAAAAIVRKAKNADISVIAYDRLIKSSELDLFISINAVKTGRMQAEAVLQNITGPNVLVLAGSPTDMNAHYLYQGQMEILRPRFERGEIHIADEAWVPDWSPEEAYNLVKRVIETKGPVDAVVASNDGTAGGAVKAVKELILDRKVVVTGMDTELSACKRILEGSQTMTVYMPIKLQASRAVEAALLMIRKEDIPGITHYIDNGGARTPSILLRPIKVDSENMEEVVVKDGYHKKEELYG